MPLWGKTDATESKPKYLSTADAAKAVFVSAEEAALATNKSKGILGAGWWLVDEYKASNGESRYKAELLVAMSVANATSGDAADDTIVADTEVSITISVQPANQTISSGGATFGVTATSSTGSPTYQWQKRVSSTARWANVASATSATLALTGQVSADNASQYRVVVSSTTGAVKVNSDAATLTYTQPSISVQPTNQNIVSGAATLTVTASGGSGTVAYQWQTAPAGSTTWTNAGTDSATLALTGLVAGDQGDQVRVIVSNNSNGTAVTSSIATLTFVS